MTLLFSGPIFLQHDTGQHPERIERLRAIQAQLDRAGLPPRCQHGTFAQLTPEAIARVHAPEMVVRVRETAEEGGGRLDPDTVVSPRSYDVGLAAAGACVAAVDAVTIGYELVFTGPIVNEQSIGIAALPDGESLTRPHRDDMNINARCDFENWQDVAE